ncbi:glycoside hydrolase family 15 protein [Streptomyces sp. ZAF1911]|uniref:glycoside hydrolase family 15 protein n=1 Tax=Streptomyces sp. ZAF1911 TaxID=2944129 RepID=UPI0030B833D6
MPTGRLELPGQPLPAFRRVDPHPRHGPYHGQIPPPPATRALTIGRAKAAAPVASPDGLHGSEGTFSICSFWYVEALARAGRLEEARLAFEKMLTYANHLGLFAEEIGPTGEQLGNFPQAFTHLSLISAAFNLDRALG